MPISTGVPHKQLPTPGEAQALTGSCRRAASAWRPRTRGQRDRMADTLTPTTPYRLAVRSLLVPAKQSNLATMRGLNPAEANAPIISASSRAPAIQPVQRSMPRSASSDRVSPMTMSAICATPGLSTRAISAKARGLFPRRSRCRAPPHLRQSIRSGEGSPRQRRTP